MKTLKIALLSLSFFSVSVLLAQDPPPPPPPGAHGSTTSMSPSSEGGGAPIGNGVWMLGALAISYAAAKRKKNAKAS